jgi:hypothetical protein
LPSNYYLEDGSYFRITNVQLTYNLPKEITSKLGLGNTAVYVQGQNLATFTKYSGMDPEVNLRGYGAGNDRMIGVDEGTYPSYRGFLAGLKLSF